MTTCAQIIDVMSTLPNGSPTSAVNGTKVIPRSVLGDAVSKPLDRNKLFSFCYRTPTVFGLTVVHRHPVITVAVRKEQDRIFDWLNFQTTSGECRGASGTGSFAISNGGGDSIANVKRSTIAFAVAVRTIFFAGRVLHQVDWFLAGRKEPWCVCQVSCKRIRSKREIVEWIATVIVRVQVRRHRSSVCARRRTASIGVGNLSNFEQRWKIKGK